MPPTAVTSGPRQRVLTRSHSLALPLADLDLSLSTDTHVTVPPPPSVAARSRAGEDSSHQASGGSRKDLKKPLRRQKSLAELFGVVIYKSRVQLQELFSRRDKDVKKDASPLPVVHQPEGCVSGNGAGVDVVMESTPNMKRALGASAGSSPQSAGPGQTAPRQKQQLMPGKTGDMLRHSNPELLSNNSADRTRRRTPEELFCVTRETSGVERPASTRSLDTLHQDRKGKSPDLTTGISSNCTGQLLRPDTDFRAKAALVKSNSDSLCRLVLPLSDDGGASLTKASSDNTCFFRRTPSPLARSRAGNGKFKDTGSPQSSPKTSNDSSIFINPVVDWLLVGSVEAAYNEPLLCSLGVEAVVDITNVPPHCVPAEKKTTCPCACSKKHFRSKLNLAVDDIEWENIEQYFDDINAFINGWRQRGKRVLVVSYHGKSRGPAVVVQHLMTYYRISLERAMAHVRSRRPQTRVNPGFVRALQRLEKRLAEEDRFSISLAPQFPPRDQASPRTAWDEC